MAFVEQFVRRPKSVWLRKAIFQIHLWTGIAVGLYVVAISVSGSVLFFRSVANEAAPGRRIVAGSGPLLTKEQLIEAAQRAYSWLPGNRHIAGHKTRPGSRDHAGARVQAERSYLRSLHGPGSGRVGALQSSTDVLHAGLACESHDGVDRPDGQRRPRDSAHLAGCLGRSDFGGLGSKKWRRSLTIDLRANWKRINWDLHSAVGFWTFAFFFMWSFTGVYLVFPAPFDALINRFAPLDYYRLISREAEPQQQAVTFVRVADVTPPVKPKRRRPKIHYSAGDQVIRTLFGMHFGNFAGLKIRILWAALGLMPPLLFVTGALMWWNRVLSREGRRLRRATGDGFLEAVRK